MNVEICDLGSWGRATLVAEYDRAADTVRIHAPAVARVRAALGATAAERFIACAIAHERFHRDRPQASEAQAHAAAHAACGVDPRVFEAVLR